MCAISSIGVAAAMNGRVIRSNNLAAALAYLRGDLATEKRWLGHLDVSVIVSHLF